MTGSNVLLVTVDSLRADRLSGVGAGERRSEPLFPRIDDLATEATVFTEAVANGPNTPSSFPTILTSTHPLMYGGYRQLSEERPFLAQILAEAGYATAGFHSNPHLGANHNYDIGFETFNDTAEGSESVATLKDRVERRLDPNSRLYSLLRRVYHLFSMTTDTAAYARADSVTDDALEWLDEHYCGDGPFFLWLHYMDVHYPFQPPEDCLDAVRSDRLPARRIADLNGRMQERPESLTDEDVADLLDLYDGEIRFVDRELGHLFDALRDRGLYDDTAVVLTADHGEAFGEHGCFGHHPYLYDELLRVPLVVRPPGGHTADYVERTDQQVSLVDLGPTLYDLLGVETPEAAQGKSFLPAMRGKAAEERPALATARSGEMLACRTRSWKCFWRVDDGVVELYDLRDDPDELRDVSAEHPEIVEQFRDRMEAYLEAAEASDVDLPDPDQDATTRQRLRDLGYVD